MKINEILIESKVFETNNQSFTPTHGISDILNEKYNIDENWKQNLAALGISGLIGLGATELATTIRDKNLSPRMPVASFNIAKSDSSNSNRVSSSDTVQKANKIENIVKPLTNSPIEKLLMVNAIRSNIQGKELAQFMAHIAYTTNNFKNISNNKNDKEYMKYDISYSPEIAKRLGNIKKGDGIKYKSRGFITIMGRKNYKLIGEALNIPLEQKPELLDDPKIATTVSIWLWGNLVKPNISDFSKTSEISLILDGNTNSVKIKNKYYSEYLNN